MIGSANPPRGGAAPSVATPDLRRVSEDEFLASSPLSRWDIRVGVALTWMALAGTAGLAAGLTLVFAAPNLDLGDLGKIITVVIFALLALPLFSLGPSSVPPDYQFWNCWRGGRICRMLREPLPVTPMHMRRWTEPPFPVWADAPGVLWAALARAPDVEPELCVRLSPHSLLGAGGSESVQALGVVAPGHWVLISTPEGMLWPARRASACRGGQILPTARGKHARLLPHPRVRSV